MEWGGAQDRVGSVRSGGVRGRGREGGVEVRTRVGRGVEGKE